MEILRRLGRIQVELIRLYKQCRHSDEWALPAASSLRGHYPITYFKQATISTKITLKIAATVRGYSLATYVNSRPLCSSEGQRSEMAHSVWSCARCRTSLRRSTAAVKQELYHASVTDYRGAATSHVHAMQASARCAAKLLWNDKFVFFCLVWVTENCS